MRRLTRGFAGRTYHIVVSTGPYILVQLFKNMNYNQLNLQAYFDEHINIAYTLL